MAQRRSLIAGNWKMNGLLADGVALGAELARRYEAATAPVFDMAVCPPATLIAPVGEAIRGSGLFLGGQDCHPADKGAHTGDIAAPMLADLECRFVILGHSERRADHRETDALVQAKAAAALKAGLTAIICVGETEAQRDAGAAESVVEGQLAGSIPAGATAETMVIAYEPVWAIGTGRTPTLADIAAMHAKIRATVAGTLGNADGVRILYGGSVKPGNAREILALADVDGALVGGASLVAEDFWQIAMACA